MLLVVVVMVVLPGMLDTSDATKRVGIAGTTSALVERALTDRAPSGENTVHHVRFDSVATGEAALRDEDVDVLVVDGRRLEWRGEPDAELQALVIGAIQVATVQQRAAVAGVDAAIAARILSPVPVENVRIGAVSGRTADDDAAVALMTVALLAAIVIYGNLVLTGVVEEKSSRVVEVLLARVPARALLGGKVVGIGLLGFAQLAVTAAAALVALMVVDSVDLPAVTGGVLAWVLVWFVLGYALYAMLYGALGSLASRTEDAQAVAGPVGYVLVAGYWASFMALSADADGPWARILSLFPADRAAGHARAHRARGHPVVGSPRCGAAHARRDRRARQLRGAGVRQRRPAHRCRPQGPRRLAPHGCRRAANTPWHASTADDDDLGVRPGCRRRRGIRVGLHPHR